MKKFTLKLHQSNFSDKALILNAKDFGDISKDDIVKIYSADTDPNNHVIIKVKELNKDGELQKNTISIEQTIASQFNLHAFQSVLVAKVDPADVSLDMVEVLFKDQYVSRSDMWRLKRHLVGSCMFLKEKIEFCDIRAQVNELWIDGVRVKCGLVSDNTRIVLRSATALVYIFIQMSKEMWEFDAYGQLQFEKVINGFLKELFQNWRGKCYHEFTLVLFSRSYFNVPNLEHFPEEIRHVVQTDYRGRFFVDYYYCVAHRERSEDCSSYLSVLKKLFNEYESLIALPKSPPGYNSSSSEGNFLEAINMSLNVFDKHYLDRNFDRTGQLVLCITPGVGVFDVDRDLTILTKERMIDNGIGSDLVCMGQQPLHAVPLFKYHKRSHSVNDERTHSFNIPHWINHSFYSLNPFLDKGAVGINHVPRASLSHTLLKHAVKGKTDKLKTNDKNTLTTNLPLLPSSRAEEFDEEIFKAPGRDSRNSNDSRVRANFERIVQHGNARIGHTLNKSFVSKQNMIREDPSPTSRCKSTLVADERLSSSVGPLTDLEKYMCPKKDIISNQLVIGSAHSYNTPKLYPSNRALINPFISSSTSLPISANRRRWVHTYPVRQNGGFAMSPHTRKAVLSSRTSESSNQSEEDYTSDNESSVKNSRLLRSNSSISASSAMSGEFTDVANGTDDASHEFLRSSGINWKTLIYPACLPVTNDYYPSKQSLNNDYTEQSYSLIPDFYEHYDGDGFNGKCSTYDNTQQITTGEVFLELVNQRLCQGFQLVVPCSVKRRKHYDSLSLSINSPGTYRSDTPLTSHDTKSPSRIRANLEETESYTLNHGRQYHIISVNGENEICVKIYKPRHTFSTSVIEYKYLLWAVGRDRFRMTTVTFTHEQYESYHWNYQDNCVCSRGADSDFRITESIKYWRSKFYIIPSMIGKLRLQKSEAEAAVKENRKTRYDIFNSDEPDEKNLLSEVDGMVKFFDYVNKARHISQLQRTVGNDGEDMTVRGNNNEKNDSDPVKLLLAIMLDENSDFPYLQPQPKLPKNAFLSINAVHWCLSKNVGVGMKEQAIALFEKMRSLNHICHASEDRNHPFLFGYIVFYVLDAKVAERPSVPNWQWLEVEIKQNKEICTPLPPLKKSSKKEKSVLTSLLEDALVKQQKTFLGSHKRKTALVPLNNKNKTGRSEWCQVQYPATILEWRNSLAFNFVIQWTVATATCLCEMLLSWLRESNRCNLLMVPSPSNPFAFPVEKDASPLHCPLFIPLNLATVKSLEVLDENECKNRIIDYMEKIAIRFGFIRYFSSLEYESQEENSRHYLHYTGQVFLEIPITSNFKVQGRTVGVRSSLGISEETHGQESLQYRGLRPIFRHCGFYFSPNHMLTKRWRTIACEDCPAPDLEADFIVFCSGSDNRLNEYYLALYT